MNSRLLGASPTKPYTGELRCAVFGAGFWSNLQIPAWSQVPGVNVVAIYNRTVSKAEQKAQKFGIPRVYSDPEQLLANEDLDILDIVTEVPAHATHVALGARHGLPVICQNPLGPDWQTCLEMERVCRAAGVPLLVNENFRWQPPFRAVRETLCTGRLGKPFRAHIELTTFGPAGFALQPFLKTVPQPALTDLGSHIFDLARFFFGEPDSIYCQTYRSSEDLAGPDVAVAMVRIGDVICTVSMSERLRTRIFVEGTDGALDLDTSNVLRVRTAEGETQRSTCPPDRHAWVDEEDERREGAEVIESIVAAQRHLIDCLRRGVEAETSVRDNLRTVRLVFAAIESSTTGRSIDLSAWAPA